MESMTFREGSRTEAYALLGAQRSVDRPAAVARLALLQRKPRVECPRYLAAIKRALWEEPPPFGTELYSEMYRSASADGQWMAISLMSNAERDGEAARRTWSLAANSVDEEERQLLKRHAVAKSRRVLDYLAFLDLSLPGAVAPAFRSALNELSPGYSMRQRLFSDGGPPYPKAPSVGDFMQMNIAEIRVTIHDLMQRTAIPRHCPVSKLPQAIRMLDSLIRDALGHVGNTALLIERKANGAAPNELQVSFCKCLCDFNRAMSEEPLEYSYNQRFGNYP